MSFESANFLYWPERTPVGGWGRFLMQQGAEPRPDGSGFPQYFVKGDDHWIDFQVVPSQGDNPERISVRIALCNPDPAVERLMHSLRLLLAEGGGTVVDQHSGKRIRILTPAAESILQESYLAQQRRFLTYFGSRKAAIPAEAVFELMRGGVDSGAEES